MTLAWGVSYASIVVAPYRDAVVSLPAARERKPERPDPAFNAIMLILGLWATVWLTLGAIVLILSRMPW